MEKYRVGVLCPSEIAFRRFMPALSKIDKVVYSGIAIASEDEWEEENLVAVAKLHEIQLEKANQFQNLYSGKIFPSYKELISSREIDAVYIPLPPALHFKWAKYALEHGKHVLSEKPLTTNFADSKKLIDLADKNGLAIHENYMFSFHSQIGFILNTLANKELGEIRLYRISFGFPFRGGNDFRYKKDLGGGALLDCGGYTIKLASILLGETARVLCHHLNYVDNLEVDLFGSGTLINNNGLTAQVSFGMDNSYKCDLEIWGSTGYLSTNRIFTAPEGFTPKVRVITNCGDNTIELGADDSFQKSIMHFLMCITNEKERKKNYQDLLKQAKLVDIFKEDK